MEHLVDAVVGFSVNPEIRWHKVSQHTVGQKILAEAEFEVSGTSFDVVWSMMTCGRKPFLVGTVGTDRFADLVQAELIGRKIAHLLLPARERTCIASIETETARHLSFKSPVNEPGPEIISRIDREMKSLRPKFQVVTGLMDDANEISLAFHLLNAEYGGVRVLNPRETLTENRPLFERIAASTDWLFLNRFEAACYLGCEPDNISTEEAEKLLDLCPLSVITCDGQGAILVARDGISISSASYEAGPKVDEKGAGDCFLGFFLSSICKGYILERSFRMAIIAAGIKVTMPGTTNIPTFEEVQRIENI